MAPLKHNWKLFEIIRAARNIRDIQVSDSCLYLHGVYSLASIAECTAMMLALRSKEKAVLMGLSFALNLPVAELPDRLGEIPKGSVIATCCASCIRAVVFCRSSNVTRLAQSLPACAWSISISADSFTQIRACTDESFFILFMPMWRDSKRSVELRSSGFKQ